MNEDQKVSIAHREKMLAYLTKIRRKLEEEEKQETLHKVPDIRIPTVETKKKKNGEFNLDTAAPWELDRQIKRKRIENLEARTEVIQLELAKAREDVIEKELVLKQTQFMLVAMRQKMLAAPTSYARKLLHKSDLREVHNILQSMMFEVLDEMLDLPMKVTDPNWLEKLNEEE